MFGVRKLESLGYSPVLMLMVSSLALRGKKLTAAYRFTRGSGRYRCCILHIIKA